MKRFAIIGIALFALSGCEFRALTPEEKSAGAAAGQIAGIPLPLSLAIMNAISLGLGALAGHKNGRRCERKHVKSKEPTNV